MRSRHSIAGVLALVASLAMLVVPALPTGEMPRREVAGHACRADDATVSRPDVSREGRAHGPHSPIVRTAVPLQGQALLPRPVLCLAIVSCTLVGECAAARPRTVSGVDAAPGETLLTKRVRLQI